MKEWGDKFLDNIPKIRIVGTAVELMGQLVAFTIKGLGFIAEALGEAFGEQKLDFGRALTNVDFTPFSDKLGEAIKNGFHVDTGELKHEFDAHLPKVDIHTDLKAPTVRHCSRGVYLRS